MARKKAGLGKTDETGESASDEVLVALETIFASDTVPDSVRSWKERHQKLNLIIAFIGDQFTNALSTMETGHPLDETTDRAIFKIVQSTATSLRHFDLTIEDAMTLVDKVSDRIKKENEIIDDVDPSDYKLMDDPKMGYSEPARRALNDIGYQCVKYILEKTEREIAPLSLPDKVIEVQRRKRKGWMYKQYYQQTHNVLLMDLTVEIDLQQRSKEIHDTIHVNDPRVSHDTNEDNDAYELTSREKMLAKICPLFRDATPKIQRDVWSKLDGSTLKQWALFFIESDSTGTKYGTKAHAIKEIVRPKAKTLEEISGKTNMRGVSIVEENRLYRRDLEKVREITNILKADAVLRKNQFVTPDRNLTET